MLDDDVHERVKSVDDVFKVGRRSLGHGRSRLDVVVEQRWRSKRPLSMDHSLYTTSWVLQEYLVDAVLSPDFLRTFSVRLFKDDQIGTAILAIIHRYKISA